MTTKDTNDYEPRTRGAGGTPGGIAEFFLGERSHYFFDSHQSAGDEPVDAGEGE